MNPIESMNEMNWIEVEMENDIVNLIHRLMKRKASVSRYLEVEGSNSIVHLLSQIETMFMCR